jgi:DNA replication and repair protein RecF
MLAASRAADGAAGSAVAGPHRSDLAVTHLGRGLPASQCSTGEQKAVLVSIVLANARLRGADSGAVPLLLLDEIAAHLDAARREALFAEILALGAQAWMTGTDAALFAPLAGRAAFFTVEDATVRQETTLQGAYS